MKEEEQETKDVKVTPTTEDKSASLVTGVRRDIHVTTAHDKDHREDDSKDG